MIGLIGEKLTHSFSKMIHEQICDYTYDLIELDADEFTEFMNKKSFQAINVTIPYKEKVIPFCDELTLQAQKIGAVNAIKNVNGKLIGTNTDYFGLRNMIENNHIQIKDKIVAICGTGGTSKTASIVCQDMQAKEVLIIGRNKTDVLSYQEMKDRQDIEVIINTTSVGMYPHNEEQIVDLNDFKHCESVIDVVYNPLTTSLCQQARSLGKKGLNGLEMLVGQAVEAATFFTDQAFDANVIQTLTQQIRKDLMNIVLIGMPSCGKSTLAIALQSHLNKTAIDIDEKIEEEANMSIPDIFAYKGEPAFRALETKTTLEISKSNRMIIACGGGVVLNEENMKALSLNGLIFYVDRDLHLLTTGGHRPLSKSMEALHKMKNERLPLYLKYSDYQVTNRSIKEAIKQIEEKYNENFSIERS